MKEVKLVASQLFESENRDNSFLIVLWEISDDQEYDTKLKTIDF